MKIWKVCSKAFTLVELLVVISIIALLLAIMMPSLNTARERSRELVCKAHLRQIAIASFTYATTTTYLPVFGIYTATNLTDFRDPYFSLYHPMASSWRESFGTPLSCLRKNGDLQDDAVYIRGCPTSRKDFLISYGYNYWFLGSNSGIRTVRDTEGTGREYVKLANVERPAETGMYCDGIDWGVAGKTKKPRSGNYGIYYWDSSVWAGYADIPGASLAPIMGHRKSTVANVGFVDGHAQSLPQKELHRDFRDRYLTLNDKLEVNIWKRIKSVPGYQQ